MNFSHIYYYIIYNACKKTIYHRATKQILLGGGMNTIMKKLKGVTVAMITPMDERGIFDPLSMSQLTDILVKKGVNALYPCGTTGEMSRLSVKERKTIAETVIEANRGRVTVFIHVGADSIPDTLNLAKHAYSAGADGVGIITPLFLGCTPIEIENYYLTIARNLPEDFPIYLYNIPQCSANDLTANIASNIRRQCPNIIGIKYSYTDFNRTAEYLDIDKDFSVLHGCDRLFSSFLALGCDGTVSGVAGVFPEPFVNVYEAYKNKDLETMQKWQKHCRRICDILKCGSNMAYFKSGLEFRGIQAGHMRSPQMDLDSRERRQLNLN